MAVASVGEARPRQEDDNLLRGEGIYTGDVSFPDQASGYVLRSPYAHAIINSIDTASAEISPGVLAVLTGTDVLADGVGTMPVNIPPIPQLNDANIYIPEKTILATAKVRYVGEPVAFIVAETLAQARDAAELVEIDFDPLPSITDTIEAVDNGGPEIWEGAPDNQCFDIHFGEREAADRAFEDAAHVVNQRMTVNRVAANPIENRVTVARYDAAADRWTVYVPVQGAFGFKNALASKFFNQPPEKFQVITSRVGGSFGMKGIHPESVLAVWAARKVGRPIRWENERSDSLASDQMGRDKVVDAELALDADGQFMGLRVRQYTNLGHHLGPTGLLHSTLSLSGLIGVYRTPAIYVNAKGLFTNTAVTGPYRGSGRPDACYVIERLADLAADHLGMDRAEIRRRNLISSEAMPYKTPMGPTYDSGDFPALQAETLRRIDYEGFAERQELSEKAGKLRGIGIANNVENAAGPGNEYATLSFDRDGHVTFVAGTTDQGQGHTTMYSQIISEQLGIDINSITVVEGDTDAQADGRGAGGSRGSAMGSGVAINAVKSVIGKGKQIASALLEAAALDIEFNAGQYTVVGTDKSVSLVDVVKASFAPDYSGSTGETGLSDYVTYESSAANYPSGCQACEVEVDPETGVIEIVRHVALVDIGRVMNPLLAKGQIMGGIAQGVGQALMETVSYDPESGQIQSGSFQDYALPRADNFCLVDISDIPTLTSSNPLGVKGVGEIGTACAMPGVVNAVLHALSPYGIDHLDMPLTPSKVWRAIRNASV